MNILVDTSVWVDYLRSGEKTKALDFLIDENLITTNELILTELIPFLRVKNQKPLITLLEQIRMHKILIDWNEIINFQTICLKNGINGVGIPDLIVAQNSIQNGAQLYTLDGHFKLMFQKISLKIFDERSK